MIDMSMGQKDIVHFFLFKRQRLIHKDIFPLFHAAVNQNIFSVHREAVTAAGNFMSGTRKNKLHTITRFTIISKRHAEAR